MRILIADDDIPFTEFLTLMIQEAGHQVVGVVTTGGPDVITAYEMCAPDAVLIDFILPHSNGIIAARRILDKQANARVVIISGLPDTDKLRKIAKDTGALALLKKPFSQTELGDLLAALRFTPQLLRAEPNGYPSASSNRPMAGDRRGIPNG
jgi:DNA-binding response OmpR family regulator